MSHELIESKDVRWFHFSSLTEEDFSFLEEEFRFHPLDYEDIRSETPISKMDIYKHYVFSIFHIPVLDSLTGRVYGADLYVFFSKNQLVTLTDEPIPTVERFVERVQKSAKLRNVVTAKGSGFLMYRLLLAAFSKSTPLVAALTSDVTRLEEEVQRGGGKPTTVELGRVRRNVLFIRHLIDPQRHMLTTLGSLKRYFIPEEMSVYFDDVHDVLDTMWLTSDNLKLIIDGLFDVNEALQAHKTNDVVFLLTVISATMLAPTLVAGFYGMNVPWLPFIRSPWAVALVYLASFILVLVVMFVAVRGRTKSS